ncbi:mannitol dehydrogenase family protein [Acuticoccus sp. I52.16.1]|uniref:mannitol dehydrogenase family protein n=1 Tax=Acuticoccus sp. I52.16.1 TaxID=2928472 RepID=UPI001FD43893|nr:mannitol dehydrogenase family protein [Acuticoccus sp. I52.16.1]UOM33006.1 mannitol dehydrogenase family protein [Acuticoccus sp. I52.16.1]
MSPRLTATDDLPSAVARPAYRREAHGVGIVHLGLGAFHKAHQAVATDDALAAAGGDWRIAGVSLRSTAPSEELTPQGGLYTLIERDADGTRARVVGAIAEALALTTDRQRVLDVLCAPQTRIVTLTVTEKGYGVDREAGGVDLSHPAIAADLAGPDAPVGVAGLLVWALGRRRAAGVAPFTVLTCDNLPENGRVVRGLLVDFARRTAPDLADYIAAEVAFPATMVDRITPARGPETLALAETLTGHEDAAAVETEAFTQWVIEDRFPSGRPAWEASGAIFVDDVRPYEDMKLRMLNGAHSMLAYAGFVAGHAHVRDVMQDAPLVALIRRHLTAAAATLEPVPGVDLERYADDLLARFANPHLAHQTYQIAMDGSQKMPQRIFAPALEAMRRNQSLAPFAFAAAAWLRYTRGRGEDGTRYALRDPREAALATDAADAEAIVAHVEAIAGLVPPALAASAAWHGAVVERLGRMLAQGMTAAIRHEADGAAAR